MNRKIGPSLETTSKGYLIALVGVFIWAFTAIFIRYLNDVFDMPPIVIAFWRDFFVAIALLVFFSLTNRKLLYLDRSQLRFILGYGFILAVFNILWTVSVKLNGAAIATVLVYGSAAFTAMYERWFLQTRLGIWRTIAILFSLLGCILVAGAYNPEIWQKNPIGIGLGLLSGIGFTSYSLLGKKSHSKGINSWTALLYTFATASVILLSLNLLPDITSNLTVLDRLFWLGDSLWGWIVLILLAIGPTIGGYGLYNLSLNYLSASVANLIATLEPSITAVFAYILLGERFTLIQIVGSILILSGVFILRLREQFGKRV